MFIRHNFRAVFAASILGLMFIPCVSSAATVTFNLGGDASSWQDPANWDTGSVPTSVDDVIIPSGTTVSGTAPSSVHDITLASGATLALNLTVTGIATFNSATNQATITGNAVFNNNSTNDGNYAIVTGDATFNGNSGNFGGTVQGNATFNGHSYNDAGTVQGNSTFNGTSFNWGTLVGNATFNNSSDNGISGLGMAQSNATFNDSSTNGLYGTVEGNACFAPTATNAGTVNGTVSVCSTSSGGYSSTQTVYGDGLIVTVKGGVTTYSGNLNSQSLKASSTVSYASLVAAAQGVSPTPTVPASAGNAQATTTTTSTSASSASSSPVLTTGALFSKSLGFGMTDPEVRMLQVFLNSHGFALALSGAGAFGYETTYFGPATVTSLIKFQRASGINPSIGVFGPVTRAFVNKILSSQASKK